MPVTDSAPNPLRAGDDDDRDVGDGGNRKVQLQGKLPGDHWQDNILFYIDYVIYLFDLAINIDL